MACHRVFILLCPAWRRPSEGVNAGGDSRARRGSTTSGIPATGSRLRRGPRTGPAGIQYAAGYRFHHCRLWNTGSPGHRRAEATRPPDGYAGRLTVKLWRRFATLAAHFAEVCYQFALPPSEGAGMRVPRCHPRGRSRGKNRARNDTSIKVRGGSPTSYAMVFNGFLRRSPR